MFHEPSFVCTTFSVGELNQACVLATQILKTLPEIHEQVLVDVAPKVIG
jgi:hypothetical protein